VTALAEFTQTPTGLTGMVGLSVLSAALGGRVVVQARPGWREPVNLYVAVALPPGHRKSAVHAELTRPLLEAEDQLIRESAARVSEASTQRAIAERAAEAARRKAAMAEGAERETAEAAAIAAQLLADAIAVPCAPRIVADDVTPEAAASLLAEQGGRLAILSAEGGCFTTLGGTRYSNTPNLEVLLKAHAGDPVRVDRKGRRPERIDRPALTLGLTVQPEVLRNIAAMPGFRGRGLLARVLYSLPAGTVGYRKIRTDPVPEEVTGAYQSGIANLAISYAGWDDPAVLQLDTEASELLLVFMEDLEPRLGPGGDLAHVADWASKLAGATARIAGLLHCATHQGNGWTIPVPASTMGSALSLGRYLESHALAVFGHMGADPALEDAHAVLAWITRTQMTGFTRRDAHRAMQSRFRRATDLDAPLSILEEHGYLRQQPAALPAVGRPPSTAYEVHPSLVNE
jgi:replicative DNA helicase